MARPRKIGTPEEFDALVNAHVEDCRENERPITWTGMAMALGFYSRQELDNYADYDGFSDAVKRAKQIVANAYEERLHGSNPTGAIFALKNMGWSDKQQYEHSGPDGAPIQLSDVEREQRITAILERARSRRTGPASENAGVGAAAGAADGGAGE